MLHVEKKKTVAGPTHVEGAAVPHAAGSIAAKLANARLRDWICVFRATCSNYRRASFYSFSKKKDHPSIDVHELGSLEDDKVVYNVLHVHSTLRRVCLGGLIVFFFEEPYCGFDFTCFAQIKAL